MRRRRNIVFTDYVANQYPVEKYKELIFIALDLVENFLLILENGFDYNSTSIAAYGEKYGSSQRNTSSKIEKIVFKNMDDEEEIKKFLNSFYNAYNLLTGEEKKYFDATFIDKLKDIDIVEKYHTYAKNVVDVRRNAIIKFCLKSGLNRFADVI